MKKSYFVESLFMAVFLCLMVLPVVSAYYLPTVREGSQTAVNSVVDFLEPILQALFGGSKDAWDGNLLFGKLLLFVVILSVVYVVVTKIPNIKNNPSIVRIISVVVSLLSVRYLDYGSIENVIIQYKVFAVVLGTIVPFIFFFFFIYTSLSRVHWVVRELGWLLFFLVFVGLWITSSDKSMSLAYFWTAAAVLVVMGFDHAISNMFMDIEAKKANSMEVRLLIQELNERKADILRAPYPNESMREEDIKKINKQILQLYRQLA